MEVKTQVTTVVEGSSFPNFHTSVYLIKAECGALILYDTGFPYDTGTLMKNLQAAGVSPEMIDYVVISHWHIDHVGSIDHFPGARLVISEDSFETLETVGEFLRDAETQKTPIEYLIDVFEKKRGWDDNVKKSQKRAMANFAYRNRHLWNNINNWDPERLEIIKNGEHTLLADITLKIIASHTGGDLMLHYQSDSKGVLFVGDVFPTKAHLKNIDREKLKPSEKDLIDFIGAGEVDIAPGHDEIFEAAAYL